MFLIYKVTNTINGKVYIGQTVRLLEVRWAQHCNDAFLKINNNRLASAIREYGRENFMIDEVVRVTDLTSANDEEIFWIQYFDSFRNGYNSTPGGRNGYDVSDETRRKQSQAKQAVYSGTNNPFYGKTHREDVIEKIKPTQFKSGQTPWNKGETGGSLNSMRS